MKKTIAAVVLMSLLGAGTARAETPLESLVLLPFRLTGLSIDIVSEVLTGRSFFGISDRVARNAGGGNADATLAAVILLQQQQRAMHAPPVIYSAPTTAWPSQDQQVLDGLRRLETQVQRAEQNRRWERIMDGTYPY